MLQDDLKVHYIAYDDYTLPADPPVVIPEPINVLVPLLHTIDQQIIDEQSLVCGNKKGIDLVIDHIDQKWQLQEMQVSILKLRERT
jgi:hypothetical protein